MGSFIEERVNDSHDPEAISTDCSYLELKELIAMHSSLSSFGGDLKTDTVTIIGATLDLQEKVVKQVGLNSSNRQLFNDLIDLLLVGDDSDRRCLHAVNQFITELRNTERDMPHWPQPCACI